MRIYRHIIPNIKFIHPYFVREKDVRVNLYATIFATLLVLGGICLLAFTLSYIFLGFIPNITAQLCIYSLILFMAIADSLDSSANYIRAKQSTVGEVEFY
mgnify:CR=1 FL=1